ncbi:shikimate dehydrogenase [Novosphingobium aquae]|uniref:Shikimate dehydrogenase (NADP(+)) n=1 Tax=Novosphingobium aquae TaxID=3133435 RepID=A0ABU8SD23_9SPHN
MKRTGLIGRSIQASRSPWLHEQEAKALGLDLRYELFDFTALGLADEELGPLLRRLAAEGYNGVNITYPFKQVVIPLLDELEDGARSVGAVNTVAIQDGRLIGYNTDKTGFQESLAEGLPEAELDVVLQLGAGGAGSAVANALLSLGTTRLEISDVDLSRAEALAVRLCSEYGPGRVVARGSTDIDTTLVRGIVNTTPMGMAAHPEPAIDPSLIASHHWVADIVYFPLETELLRLARVKGCRTLDGSGMVIGQAARAFQIFTGLIADKKRMRATFAAC